MLDFKNYERLTKRDWKLEYEIGVCSQDVSAGECPVYNDCFKYIQRLGELEDLIEQGKLVEKTEMRIFVEDVEKLLCDYLYENVNGENVMLVAPYLELMPKAKEITKKYGVEE